MTTERRFALESQLEAAGALFTDEWPPRVLPDYIWQNPEEFAARWHTVNRTGLAGGSNS